MHFFKYKIPPQPVKMIKYKVGVWRHHSFGRKVLCRSTGDKKNIILWDISLKGNYLYFILENTENAAT